MSRYALHRRCHKGAPPDRLFPFSGVTGIPKYVKDYKDLIASPDVDAVLICSPTDQVRPDERPISAMPNHPPSLFPSL